MKFVASLLAVIIVFGLFSACNNSIGSPSDGGQSSENQQLHIVDKKVDYPSTFSAMSRIEYDTSNVIDTAQIENILYVLETDGLHIIDLSSGEQSVVLGDMNIRMIASYEDELYAFSGTQGGGDSAELNIYTLDKSGVETSRASMSVSASTLKENMMLSTDEDGAEMSYGMPSAIAVDDYFVIYCYIDGDRCFVHISKDNPEVISSVKESVSQINSTLSSICRYLGNSYLVYSQGALNRLKVYDIERNEYVEEINTSFYSGTGIAYDQYADSAILSGSSNFGMNISELELGTLCVNRIASYASEFTGMISNDHVTAYGNLYCLVSSRVNDIRVYDAAAEQPTVNIVLDSAEIPSSVEYVTVVLSEKYGINVRTRTYADSGNVLPTKISAQDTDIDIIYNVSNLPYYIVNGYYADLNEFDVLKDNIEECKSLLEQGYSYDGKIFGVPYVDANNLVDDPNTLVIDCSEPTTVAGIPDSAHNFDAYLARYVDITEKAYTDEGGEMLCEYLMHRYENKDDSFLGMPTDTKVLDSLSSGVKILKSNCWIMNPAGANKENAAIFLNELMNLATGKTDEAILDSVGVTKDTNDPFSGLVDMSLKFSYYDLDYDYGECIPQWKSSSSSVRSVLSEAVGAAVSASSESEIKSIANDYYDKIMQAIME